MFEKEVRSELITQQKTTNMQRFVNNVVSVLFLLTDLVLNNSLDASNLIIVMPSH